MSHHQRQQGKTWIPTSHITQPPRKKKVVRFDHVVYQVPHVYVDGGGEDEFRENDQIHVLPHSRYHHHGCYLEYQRSKRWSNDGSRSPNDVSPPIYPKRRNSLRSGSPSQRTNRMMGNNRSQDGRMEHDERGQYKNHFL
eukprot:scaffold26340_cov103-Cylindrotheca_fusiformis.AAC.3